MMSALKGFRPVIILFVLLTGVFLALQKAFENWGADPDVVIIGNLLLFAITLISFVLGVRGLAKPNPHAFVRSVYTSMMLKLVLCIIAVFIYVSLNRTDFNHAALFICFGLYMVYTFMEVSILTRLLKGNTNGKA